MIETCDALLAEPTEKEELIRAIGVTIDTRFDEHGHEHAWRNGLAKDLNVLLRTVTDIGATYEFARNSTLRIVGRIAQFEGIRKV